MLLVPGPVDVPEEVIRASAYLRGHRSDDFREIVRSSSDLLNRFVDSEETVITTGSGTTAVESMIYSMTRRSEKVLAVSFGEFGNRMIESLHRHGCDVTTVEKTSSQSLSAGEVSDLLQKHRDIQAVCLVHNETGNGTALHNIREIAKEAKDHGAKVLVDSVSGLGGIEIRANSWGIDAIAGCSQKAIASMPGLGTVSFSEEGIGYVLKDADVPKYMDLSISLKFMEKDETPYTPSTGSFNALNTALRILDREGIERRWQRHSAAASFVRKNLSEMGSEFYGNSSNYSDTVLAFNPPVEVNKMVSDMRSDEILVSKGMKEYSDKMVRVGLLGVVDALKISRFLNTYFKSVGSDKRIEPSDVPKDASFDRRLLEELSEELP